MSVITLPCDTQYVSICSQPTLLLHHPIIRSWFLLLYLWNTVHSCITSQSAEWLSYSPIMTKKCNVAADRLLLKRPTFSKNVMDSRTMRQHTVRLRPVSCCEKKTRILSNQTCCLPTVLAPIGQSCGLQDMGSDAERFLSEASDERLTSWSSVRLQHGRESNRASFLISGENVLTCVSKPKTNTLNNYFDVFIQNREFVWAFHACTTVVMKLWTGWHVVFHKVV